jgi:RsiW-degrading membrane proteinase PrsW (M82 family)
MGLLLSLINGFVPMLAFSWILYWLDRFEKEPKLLLGIVFTWGALVAAGVAFITNTVLGIGVYWLTGSDLATGLFTGSFAAPLIEESLKGFAVLLVFVIYRQEFDTILDGVVFAGITALGFAASENAYYIYNYGFLENGFQGLFHMAFIRVILVGWQHPFYTAFIGIGLALARFQSGTLRQAILIMGGWVVAVTTHAIHNTIATLASGPSGLIFGTMLDWTGWALMVVFILWQTHQEKKWIRTYLIEEVGMGTLSMAQYRTAASGWAISSARFSALFHGNFRFTSRFYTAAAEIAFTKEKLRRMGEEQGNSRRVEVLRAEMRKLSPRVHT